MICYECLKKERKERLITNIKSILENLYYKVMNKELPMSVEGDPELQVIGTKNSMKRRIHRSRSKSYKDYLKEYSKKHPLKTVAGSGSYSEFPNN